MNQILRWSLLGGFVFVVSMVLTVPAKQGLVWLQLSNDIVLHGVSGRLLNGQAQAVTINNTQLHHVTWVWQPLDLILGKLGVNWSLADQNILGEGKTTLSIIGKRQMTRATASLTLAKVQTWLPKEIHLTGQVKLDIKRLLFENKVSEVDASFVGQDIDIISVIGKVSLPSLYVTVIGSSEKSFFITIKDDQKMDGIELVAKLDNNEIHLTGEVKRDAFITKQIGSVLLPLIAKKEGLIWRVNWRNTL